MISAPLSCVLLADAHPTLSEGLRGLLQNEFGAVVMVADEISLLESARNLKPALVVADLSLGRSANLQWISQLRSQTPNAKLIILSVHDEPNICLSAMKAGADGFVLARSIATDLLPAVDAVMSGQSFISSDLVFPDGAAPADPQRPTAKRTV